MPATEEQIRELAGAIADQAQAIADDKVAVRHGAVRRLLDNVELLEIWTATR